MTLPTYIGDSPTDLPTGWAAGDLFLLSVESAAQTVNTPSGWNVLSNSPQSTGSSGGTSSTASYVFWRLAQSGDTVPTVSGPADHTYKRFTCWRGVDQTTPILITAGSVLASAGLTGTATGFTTTADDCLIVMIGTTHLDRPSGDLTCTVANASLASLTARFTGNSNTGNGGGQTIVSGTKATAGVVGSTTFTWSESSIQAMLVLAIQPPVPVTEQYAVKSGNWNDTTVWSTGAVPTTGDVFSNNYTVTVNVNASATKITNKAGTVAVAGGSFVLSNGVTLTANVEAGATTCVTAATGVTAGITGDITGGTATSAYGFNKSGTGTFTLTGNLYGGTGSSAAGGINSGSGTVAITGSVYGNDSTSTGYGYRTTSSGTTTIGGSVYAGAATGVLVSSTGAVTVGGSVYASATMTGMQHTGTGNSIVINGDSVGGAASTAYGLQCTSSGNATVAGAAISPSSPGVGAGVGVTGTGYATIGTSQTGTGGGSPCVGHVHVADLSAFTYLVRSSSSSVTLSADADVPSPFAAPAVFGGA